MVLFFLTPVITVTHIVTFNTYALLGTHMAKAVAHSVKRVLDREFGMDKEIVRIACTDGTSYEFRRQVGNRRWRASARYGRDGSISINPPRLPACVEAHMDGRTRSGPHGEDADDYWV